MPRRPSDRDARNGGRAAAAAARPDTGKATGPAGPMRLKDRLLETVIRAFLNERFPSLGHADRCRVDTRAGRVELTARLAGETAATTLGVGRYVVHRERDGTWITLHDFSCSRTWIAALLTQLCDGHRYPLPGAIARLL